MGCTASTDNNLRELEELKQYVRHEETKAHEQQNLLRFKMEVLVNMLAVEEKRNDMTSKRLDTLKWMIHSQGVTEETITKILNSMEKDGKLLLDASFTFNPAANAPNSLQTTQLMDLQGAVQRMKEEFKQFRADIIHSYALNDGKLLTSLPIKDWIEQTYNVTENISKSDLKLLAMRFDDGYGAVCIPEFIEYFSLSSEKRNAKIAERAVKMSLDLLSLDVELLEEEEEMVDEEGRMINEEGKSEKSNVLRKSIMKDDSTLYDEVDGAEVKRSHFTRSLDRGAKRLLVMWLYVREELEKTFLLYQKAHSDIYDENNEEEIIEIDIFKVRIPYVWDVFSLLFLLSLSRALSLSHLENYE
jgi:hypothetical protein